MIGAYDVLLFFPVVIHMQRCMIMLLKNIPREKSVSVAKIKEAV